MEKAARAVPRQPPILLGPSVLEKRHTRRKQPNALKTNWPIVSVCHAGRLADHQTPVGSVDL